VGLNIGVTGYFGSGSSAVLDLLAEYSCNGTGLKDAKGVYEHTTLYRICFVLIRIILAGMVHFRKCSGKCLRII